MIKNFSKSVFYTLLAFACCGLALLSGCKSETEESTETTTTKTTVTTTPAPPDSVGAIVVMDTANTKPVDAPVKK